VKATNLGCIQRNRECQSLRQTKLDELGKSSRLHVFFNTLYKKLKDLEDQTEELFNEAERTRKERDFAVIALNRTMNTFKIIEQESKLANQSIENQQSILRREICVMNQYDDHNQNLDLTINRITFSGKLPFVENLKLTAKVKRVSTGAALDVSFIYQFDDPENSLEAAAKKIVYQTFS